MTAAGTPARARPAGRARSALAGVLAAGLSLAVGRLGARLLDGAADPLVAVGRQVIDRTPASVLEPVVGAVGTADKPLLVGGITAVVLALGAGAGVLHPRRRSAAVLVVAVLWTVGGLAIAVVPGAEVVPALLLAGGSALVGLLALDLLAPRRTPAPPPAETLPAETLLGETRPAPLDRRTFVLRSSGLLVGVAAALAAGSALSRRAADGLVRVLPAATRRAVRPARPGSVLPGRTALVTSNADLYRIDTALVAPVVDADAWSLSITGLVDRPRRFSYQDLQAMPQVEGWITLGCVGNEVGGPLVGTALWQGVLLADLLRAAGVRPEATQLVGLSVDGYTGAFPSALALDGRDALIAIGMNGVSLPVEHGFPARMVVPGLYGYESAVKWIEEVRLVDDTYEAYWVRRGYAKAAEFRTQSRIDLPRGGQGLPPGPVTVAGMAWAPHRGVRRVEVRVDDGPWLTARLDQDELGPDAWRPWSLELPLAAGDRTLTVRATDGAGATQPAARTDVLPDGATGHHAVTVRVGG